MSTTSSFYKMEPAKAEEIEEKSDSTDKSIAHTTLKYQLLGPSLTKAGQDAVDQQKVSDIIYNASKGSKFFNHEETRDQVLTTRINHILSRKKQLEKCDLSYDRRRADEHISKLELSRDLSQSIVHIDCDAFFAAVEELDRPELRDLPMAVGGGVLTTCNYHARKFGCRSGMASFVAKKLCPDLILIRQNYEKYNEKAKEIRAIIETYDPRFESASIDEAYLNITQYCAENDISPEAAVQKLRSEVLEKTKVSVSAGIAANSRISKICSNWNKPNGQYFVPSDRDAIMTFMSTLPPRKVNGVGRVFERELQAVGIKTCGDIYPHRAILTKLFGEKASNFLLQCYLGLGRTNIQPAEESERKSVGTESTFSDMGGATQLRDKLWRTAEELEKDLARTHFKGRTLVLKVKLHTFEVLTRQIAPPKAVYLAKDLYNYALPMLTKLEKNIPGMKLRLMGLRCTNLVSTKKPDVSFFGTTLPARTSDSPKEQTAPEQDELFDDDFENAARQEKEDEMDALEMLSQELSSADDGHNPTKPEGSDATQATLWECPVCKRQLAADDRTFNDHVDFCLSRQVIREAARGPSAVRESPSTSSQHKRKGLESLSDTKPDAKQKRLFFS
ncbi:hypothetical protein FQN54_003901 [Arachnomyces sp. PD_36]|nr:hypothetical protein FQN54_003901 [Arachnomyces sp. PD_36]